MIREEVHRCWAPAAGRWTPWVKPALFASLDDDFEPRPIVNEYGWVSSELTQPMSREGRSLSDTALVIDLPGDSGVRLGAALVEFGFRPVPLYNAVQWECAVVDLRPIGRALFDVATQVARAPLDAPPAFLLDAHRMSGAHLLRPGAFDNRSYCSVADFPSLETLRAHGIRRAVLIQEEHGRPAPDLEPILFSWQRGDIELWCKFSDHARPAAPFLLQPRRFPIRFAHALRRAWWRATVGEHGRFVPMPAAG